MTSHTRQPRSTANGSRAGALARSVRITTVQNIAAAASSEVVPAIHNGRVSAPSWKNAHAIATTPPTAARTTRARAGPL